MGFFNELGVLSTRLSFWFSVFLLVIAIWIGASLFFSNHHSASTDARLSDVKCTSYVVNQNQGMSQYSTTKYECTAKQTYTVNGTTYIQTLNESNLSSPHTDGETMTVNYDPDHPTDTGISRNTEGLVIGIVVVVLAFVAWMSYLRYQMSKKSKTWATGEGFLTTFNVGRNIFS